ncbi:S-methyl-5'-thioadenosine phosphorylase [Nitrospira sp. KM1]|nr:S-methyl-5'-thioadenosine phosphorylase [Nitrospira sp. KM1]BCA54402.1 S-methyl-5'-thioadenosine phosphorylase [Nitrospira sp. KM1]
MSMKVARVSAPRAQIGIIGGSGLYAIDGLKAVQEIRLKTPFGSPSDAVVLGELNGIRVAFLSRHGRGHRFNPSEINYRANIYALKSLGVRRVISVSAVGSMKESIAPGDVVLPDQFIDCTKRRASTFFEGGAVAHVAFAEPVCSSMSASLAAAARTNEATVHHGGTYLCIEGPQFSTKAESRLYRQWGVSVIGMTNLPEAKLAREAELCYATVALVTDFDCWHESEEPVTVEAILNVLHRNVSLAKRLVAAAIGSVGAVEHCACQEALAHAIVTAPNMIPPKLRTKLALLTNRVLPTPSKGKR